MASYQVTCHVADNWVKIFNDNNYFFCIAKCVVGGNGEEVFNVIFTTQTTGSKITASWNDTFQMYGSLTEFQNGGTIESSSTPLDVAFKQKYVLPADLADPTVDPDPTLPAGTFAFQNSSVISCVVANGTTGTPIYISPSVLPPGTDELTPKAKVKVWFGQKYETGAMISIETTQNYEIDLTGDPVQDVWYTKDGTWSPTPPTSGN
ncbi:hypothetical protein K440DRAFT_663955 [Wilcoxina mikolae CBS 423.85]|nr:hypothetical protein K440DRAFT_663955 [Wilcoxina mikolae CBS 423.85]